MPTASPAWTPHPDDGNGVALWADAAYPYLMLFTGDPLPEIDRRSFAVEPMTCPPDAFRSGEALIALEPGASWVGEWGIAPNPGGGRREAGTDGREAHPQWSEMR